MDLKKFLTVAASSDFWAQRQTLCFTGSEYSAALFAALFNHVRKHKLLATEFQRIDIVGREKRELYGLLGQSILGSTSFFWLGNTSDERDSKAASAFKQYLCTYEGPHSIAFFIATPDLPVLSQAAVITLPTMLDMQEFIMLAQWFGNVEVGKKTMLFEDIFYNRKQSLQECVLLSEYIALASIKHKSAFIPYLQELYAPETNLQQLAEYFFAKREKDFFITWDKVHEQYPPIFWVIFWAEQVWRALHVVRFMQQKQFVHAKKMSFRLPYSFINKEWQRVQVAELTQCYEFLYQIDYAIKTGSIFCSQDLFFVHYFAGVFAKEGAI